MSLKTIVAQTVTSSLLLGAFAINACALPLSVNSKKSYFLGEWTCQMQLKTLSEDVTTEAKIYLHFRETDYDNLTRITQVNKNDSSSNYVILSNESGTWFISDNENIVFNLNSPLTVESEFDSAHSQMIAEHAEKYVNDYAEAAEYTFISKVDTINSNEMLLTYITEPTEGNNYTAEPNEEKDMIRCQRL